MHKQAKQTLKGCKEIAEAVEQSERAIFHMLRRGQIRTAVKKGRCWYANRDTLLREFGKQQQHEGVV
jgi:hypothetical protein